MKKILIFSAFALIAITPFAQDFPGFRSGNYTGVNGVFFNPANIADSRYRWDVNLFSLSTFVGNDQATFNLKTIGETFKEDGFTKQVINGNAGPTSALVNANVTGPSFMFNIGKKSAIAITSRARVMVNVIDIDGKLLKQLSDDANSDQTFPYSINSSTNMRLAMNAWSEIGASYARTITEKGPHFLKGGVTLKYLGGVGNGFVNIDNFKSTINKDILNDVYLNNTTGQIGVGFGGVNFSDFDVSTLGKMESSGFGADLGFVYEFRPADKAGVLGKNRNKYKFKIGVALMDVGAITYNKDMQRSGSYNIDITGVERLSLKDIAGTNVDNYNSFFKSRPQFFTPATGNNESTYKVSLPTTLNLDFDYHVKKGFYVSASGLFSLVSKTANVQNGMFYSNFNVTPRLETKMFGVYLPIGYNELTKFNAGISLRAGPLFFGSGSVISSLLGDSKQADVHLGIRFGGLQKK